MRRRRTSILALAIAAALVLGVSQASAATLVFSATLAGSQEVPPTGSAGTAFAEVSWDTTTNLMTVTVAFAGLGSPTVASHIHCCAAAGINAMVATPIPTFPNFPLGVTIGTYSQTFDMTQASSYNAAFVTAHGGTVAQAEADLLAGLQAGTAYLNIHTSQFPGGEIRGQLQMVTAVQVKRLSATRSGKSVRLQWRTASEAGTLGFNVYRGRADARKRVSHRLIPARGGVEGAAYTWRDGQRGSGSLYWLQIVRMDGSRSWYGPARVH